MSPRSEGSFTSRKPRPSTSGGARPARTGGPRLARGATAPADSAWGERTLLEPAATGATAARSGRSNARSSSAEPSAESSVRPASVGAAAKPPNRTRSADRRRGTARSQRVPFAVLLAGVIAAGMCALLALNTATAASEVRERHVDAANSSLSAKQEQLSRALAVTQAPAELSRMAARLGLVPAGSPAFLRLNADGTVTVLGAPAKVPTPPVPLTAAQQAAAKAAILKAAKDKAAKAAAAKAAKATKTPTSKTPTSKTPTGKTPTSKTPTSKTPTSKTPTRTPPAKTPKTTPKTKATPVPTVTLPGGPR